MDGKCKKLKYKMKIVIINKKRFKKIRMKSHKKKTKII